MGSPQAGNRGGAGNPILQTLPEPAPAGPCGQGGCVKFFFLIELKFMCYDIRHLNCFKVNPSAFFNTFTIVSLI